MTSRTLKSSQGNRLNNARSPTASVKTAKTNKPSNNGNLLNQLLQEEAVAFTMDHSEPVTPT